MARALLAGHDRQPRIQRGRRAGPRRRRRVAAPQRHVGVAGLLRGRIRHTLSRRLGSDAAARRAIQVHDVRLLRRGGGEYEPPPSAGRRGSHGTVGVTVRATRRSTCIARGSSRICRAAACASSRRRRRSASRRGSSPRRFARSVDVARRGVCAVRRGRARRVRSGDASRAGTRFTSWDDRLRCVALRCVAVAIATAIATAIAGEGEGCDVDAYTMRRQRAA